MVLVCLWQKLLRLRWLKKLRALTNARGIAIISLLVMMGSTRMDVWKLQEIPVSWGKGAWWMCTLPNHTLGSAGG